MKMNKIGLLFFVALSVSTLIAISCGNKKEEAKDIRTKETFHFPELDQRIDSLLIKYNIPGVAVAIVRNDSLVYINCYGVQDVDKQIPMQNSSLFRIASISKPITVVALLKLMQEGKLAMDDKVFGEGSILGYDFGILPEKSAWKKISIRHLIEHKSGIQNHPDDPMFGYKGLTNRDIIERIIAERPLATEPGEKDYYSNVGYNILGRVIEKITGMSYDEYVQQAILEPSGITRMKLAKNTQEERFDDEVVYCQPDEEGWTYTMDVHRMDAHGGWIASATDLARFIAHVDRVSIVPDIVNSDLLNQTYLGFEQWTHTGSLPGTATMLTRMNDEFSFVFLANRRSWNQSFWDDISSTMQGAIKERNEWPKVDMFRKIDW